MRVGTVPYLNSLPLVFGLPWETYTAVPSQLAKWAGPEDIVLAPMVTAFEERQWHLIDGVGIGSFGPVETVKLFFNKDGITIQNVNTIFLDVDSKTSAALFKILLHFFYERPLHEIRFTPFPRGSETSLLIGDKVWEEPAKARSIDLGEVWTAWTKFPFVYACWMSRSESAARAAKPILIKQAEKNLANLNRLVRCAPPNRCPDLLQYWRQLRFCLDEFARRGIKLFQKKWAGLEAKPIVPLHWI